MKMLRKIRKEKGLTMKQLGSIVGVTEAAISQYETGKREADFETLLKISEALDCTVDYLLGREIQKEKPGVSEDDELSEKKKLVINKIKNMDDGQIEAIDRIADSILSLRKK